MTHALPSLEAVRRDVGGGDKSTRSRLEDVFNRLTRDRVPYASHYCEENTYKLIEILYAEYAVPDDAVFAVFVSNERKQTPVWMQRLAEADERDPVLWDYHVIALMTDTSGNWWVWDHDTVLPYPCSAKRYIMESFRPEMQMREEYRQWFRVISGRKYLANFSSDRSHMRTSDVPPPPWPIIQGFLAATTMQLPFYWNMAKQDDKKANMDGSMGDAYGNVVNIEGMMALVSND
ncbi:hypothetical protein C3747_57g260 [Trypanosoma cruzi]|uniref:Protein N-terminal glutamine amidohydrolase n=2 Tax=Trypanosoma cruzi TaxID=5693 RepID=Q4DYR2_TRYCC|nr:hypothetical protein, conserved [Trypanosoma cruzi]EAN97668.1 hypothetical protein, conserved [Trypanosoma cruzi]PWV11637.1 hypothetical protein C3747_57g260 [Trypanosoma cruzi]|eukprot:XP_819519.1 hypothetical protein [Trypanosoma cruzi strain CL Brener]